MFLWNFGTFHIALQARRPVRQFARCMAMELILTSSDLLAHFICSVQLNQENDRRRRSASYPELDILKKEFSISIEAN
jgi:hypothetical protein